MISPPLPTNMAIADIVEPAARNTRIVVNHLVAAAAAPTHTHVIAARTINQYPSSGKRLMTALAPAHWL